jgi:hypothetical protein
MVVFRPVSAQDAAHSAACLPEYDLPVGLTADTLQACAPDVELMADIPLV